MGADCKRFTDWALLFRLPELESAPKPLEKVIHSPPHSLWTANNAVGRGVRTRPPVAEFQRVCPYTPQQKIFAKVRSRNMALTCGFKPCEEGHITKAGIGLNFLPYI